MLTPDKGLPAKLLLYLVCDESGAKLPEVVVGMEIAEPKPLLLIEVAEVRVR